ncbi:HWE histidine kinase domain-containing protein [Allorhizobium taibaishanense]|uniref:histidine kinase n=1 Tax=Allorhizobium taibaishanense TaxID=887144 RepID=A0A1Q9A4J1_9HYPH|nr:HWE histidine kinase domain-containing protein [Allorhizobium taibaishanense]MBB4006539.1 light-regulated signal transduction histidine kinase (bacteriophytochrome)/ActR/RegA family two-component response regulator [Allorhizobium taibaishanense]OLP49466.1 signal transduction histidine kinase [Allorhizobium taibaishanense]
MPATQTVDLSNCDREPIHIPGSIQPHGWLLACDAEMATVLRHSANAGEMLDRSGDINGMALDKLIGDKATHDLRNALATAPQAARPALLPNVELACGRRFDVSVHRQRANVIIEFEPAWTGRQPLQLAREMIGRIKDIEDVDRLIRASAKLVRAVLGYDRVMIYRFDNDGSGKVVSEAKSMELESFLGQYFPASDIPQQARKLYVQNSIRVITSASGNRVAIEPVLDPSGQPLDLSFAHLRSVSPIHLEYLRNMGVGASMSISILLNGELWGLIACHHYREKTLSMAERVAAELFGEFFSLNLLALKQKHKLNLASEARQSLDRFVQLASHHEDLNALFADCLPEFRSLVACDGVGLWLNGAWTSIGASPPAGEVEPLVRFVNGVAEGQIWASHALSNFLPRAESYSDTVSGVMVVPLSQIPRDYMLFFRKERLQTLNWAGNPDKSYEVGPLGDRLTPRKSFAIWKEAVIRQSDHWSDSDREIAEAIRAVTVKVVLRHSELMQEERNKADIRQRVLNEELNHRVKNILAVIKSLVGVPTRPEHQLRDYVTSLKGRVHALSHAHDQVIRGSGNGELRELLEAELSPYSSDGSVLSLEGPLVVLDSRAYAVTALVIHELATNAAKYGALSRGGGTLGLIWRWTDAGDCEILWTERGGPTVTTPTRRGFGSALIDRSIPYDLGGKSTVTYDPGGLTAHLLLPSRFLSGIGQASEAAPVPHPKTETRAMATIDKTLPILLVEDQMLIAMDAEMMLGDAGFTTVMTAGSVPDALAQIKGAVPALAVLDINLGNHTSVPVAEELYQRGIPFLFATGYAERSIIPDAFRDVTIINKPYDSDALTDAVMNLLRQPDATHG